MTAAEAERQLRAMLARLRRRSGQISQTEIRRYELAIRALASRLTPARAAALLSPTGARRLARSINTVLDEVDRTLVTVAKRSVRAIATTIQSEYGTVHARLYEAQGLASGRLVQRFAVIPQRIEARLARIAGQRLTLDRLVTRNVDAARVAVERYIRAATGKVPDELAVRSLLNLLDGKLPIDLAGLGIPRTALTDAKGLLAKGRMIIGTESFNSMREGTAVGSTLSPIIFLARWLLSDGHADLPSSPDECDDLATQDVGHGPGLYLPEEWPEAPHPNCGCRQGDPEVLAPSEWPQI